MLGMASARKVISHSGRRPRSANQHRILANLPQADSSSVAAEPTKSPTANPIANSPARANANPHRAFELDRAQESDSGPEYESEWEPLDDCNCQGRVAVVRQHAPWVSGHGQVCWSTLEPARDHCYDQQHEPAREPAHCSIPLPAQDESEYGAEPRDAYERGLQVALALTTSG
jgi:hypothetical protein